MNLLFLILCMFVLPSWSMAATGSSASDIFYVRPASACPNNGDGLAYGCAASEGASGAFSALTNVSWTSTTGVDDGDTLYVCGTHPGYLLVGTSAGGTASSPISIRFDCLNDPGVIRNITAMTEASTANNWTNESGSLWYLSVVTYTWKDPKRLWTDGTERFAASQKTALGTSEGGPDAYWWYDSGNSRLYVYAGSNPSGTFTLMESLVAGASAGAYAALAITNEANDYINIIDPTLQGGNLYSLYITGGDVISVTGSRADDSACHIGAYARSGILISDTSTAGTGNESSFVTVQNCTIDPLHPSTFTRYTWQCCSSDGVNVVYGTSYNRILSNTIRDWGHVNVQVSSTLGTESTRYNFIEGNRLLCSAWVEYCRGMTIAGTSAGRASYNKFRANYIDGQTIRSQLNGDLNEVVGNVWINQRQGTVSPTAVQSLDMEGYTDAVSLNNVIAYNTFANNTFGPCLSFRAGTNTKSGYRVIGNLLRNCGGTAVVGYENAALTLHNDASVGSQTLLNNLIYDTDVSSTVFYKATGATTVAGFQSACSGDTCAGNLASNPLTYSATDLRLQSSSPAWRAGIIGPCFDVRGRVCPSDHPNIGAYQSTSSDPAATRTVRN